ncbi:RNA-directed DNA polymerase, eukaryota, reverse transcriptase zinc-binding domain protein [Tanacetum coccineum]
MIDDTKITNMIYMGSSRALIDEFKSCMMNKFEMSDLGLLQYFLGLEVLQKEDGIFVCQKKYVTDLLKRFHMSNYEVEATPMNLDEKLQLNDGTRKADGKFFRSLVDSDWAGCLDTRKSTSENMFSLGYGAVTWSSKKQETLALLSSEAEYAAVTSAARQALWLMKLLVDFSCEQKGSTEIFCDNSCVSSEQTTFIKGRNILDGPLTLSEMISWYQKRKKELMIFKVDFEKAFDSVRWDFLDLVMDKLGFGLTWRTWIHGCLKNGRSSVLINGSPTPEFETFKGLRQGDPVSPFLFILVMEALHAITRKAVDLGLFRGASIGQGNLNVSHLMYADDVIFMGEWSNLNVQNLLCMLRCFYLVSGLKINVHKSNIIGVYVPNVIASDLAKSVGCKVASLPIKYLGVPVGCKMSRCEHWNPIIQNFASKLAHWKARLYPLEDAHLDPKDACNKKGGLGIGSINALNLGLLFKWLWRFRCQSYDLWAKVITCVYGVNGGINDDRVFPYSTWGAILSSVKRLNLNGIDLLALCTKKISNSARTSFWNDPWCSSSPLKVRFPRIFMLETDKGSMVSNRLNIHNWSSILRRAPRGGIESSQLVDLLSAISAINLSDQPDSWVWSLNPAVGFTVASVRKLALNKLPTRVNLDRKGIDVDSTMGPICDVPFCSSFSDGFVGRSSHLSAKGKFFLDGVGGTVLWTIWNYRNRLIFSVDPPKKASLWDFIVSQSFLWISSRKSKS